MKFLVLYCLSSFTLPLVIYFASSSSKVSKYFWITTVSFCSTSAKSARSCLRYKPSESFLCLIILAKVLFKDDSVCFAPSISLFLMVAMMALMVFFWGPSLAIMACFKSTLRVCKSWV